MDIAQSNEHVKLAKPKDTEIFSAEIERFDMVNLVEKSKKAATSMSHFEVRNLLYFQKPIKKIIIGRRNYN